MKYSNYQSKYISMFWCGLIFKSNFEFQIWIPNGLLLQHASTKTFQAKYILCLRNANSAKSVLTFLLSREIYLTSSDPILTHFLIVYVVYIRATYQLFMVYCIIMSPQLIKQNYPFTFVGIMLVVHIQKFVESISVMIWNAVVKQLK